MDLVVSNVERLHLHFNVQKCYSSALRGSPDIVLFDPSSPAPYVGRRGRDLRCAALVAGRSQSSLLN